MSKVPAAIKPSHLPCSPGSPSTKAIKDKASPKYQALELCLWRAEEGKRFNGTSGQ